jgi:hypothetical protein
MAIEFAGELHNNVGAAIEGATVDLFARNTATESTASPSSPDTTTTDGDGKWSFSKATQGRYDVRITSGTSIRWRIYDDAIQMEEIELKTLAVRGGNNLYKVDITIGNIGADATLAIPVIGTSDTLAVLGLAQTFSAAQTFTSTVTVGADDAGHDVKFFGDTASAYILWDTSADKLLTAGGAVVDIVKDKLLIGGTAVTTTAAELNVLDAVTAGTVSASLGVVVDSSKDIGSFRNVTLTGELDAATLDLSSSADIAGDLVLSGGADGALQFTNAGENSIKIPDDQASALIIEEDDNAYITFVTSNGSEAITVAKATTFSAGIANAGTIAAGTWNGADVGVAYGGTGASTLTDGGVLLGSGTGAVTAMAVLADSEMIVGDGTTDPVAESGATLRTSIGLGTGNNVEFAALSIDYVNINGRIITSTSGDFSIDASSGNAIRLNDAGADADVIMETDTNTSAFMLNAGANTLTISVDTTLSGLLTIEGGQIAFPATENASAGANVLDDYEEGTWTPTMVDLSSSDESQAYSTQTGRYTKIGNRCYIQGRMGLTSLGSLTTSQQARIAALPFTPANVSEATNPINFSSGTGLALANASESVVGYVGQNDPHVTLSNWDVTTGTSDLLLSEVSADGFFIFSGWYEV